MVHVLAGLFASVIMSSALAKAFPFWTLGTLPRKGRSMGMHYHLVFTIEFYPIKNPLSFEDDYLQHFKASLFLCYYIKEKKVI